MKRETYEALQAEIDSLENKRQRAFKRGMILGGALNFLGFVFGFWVGLGLGG